MYKNPKTHENSWGEVFWAVFGGAGEGGVPGLGAGDGDGATVTFFFPPLALPAQSSPRSHPGAPRRQEQQQKEASGRSERPGLPRLRIISPRLCPPPPQKSVERKKKRLHTRYPVQLYIALLIPVGIVVYRMVQKCAFVLEQNESLVAQRDGENGDSGCSSSVTGHNSGCSSSVTGNTSV